MLEMVTPSYFLLENPTKIRWPIVPFPLSQANNRSYHIICIIHIFSALKYLPENTEIPWQRVIGSSGESQHPGLFSFIRFSAGANCTQPTQARYPHEVPELSARPANAKPSSKKAYKSHKVLAEEHFASV